MTKNNKITVVLSVFMVLIVLLVLFIKTPIDLKIPVDTEVPVDNMSVNAQNPVQELKVGGLFIEFEEGTTEPEVKAILENCNMTRNWIIEYNVDSMGNIYYVKVDENKKDELSKKENWNDPEIPEPRFPEIEKGNYSYIIVSEEGFEDESFLKVMEKHNLQVKKSIVCYILFGDGSQNWNEPENWIPERDAVITKNKLEVNETVMIVSPDYIEG